MTFHKSEPPASKSTTLVTQFINLVMILHSSLCFELLAQVIYRLPNWRRVVRHAGTKNPSASVKLGKIYYFSIFILPS